LDATGAPAIFDNEFDALDDRLKQQMVSFAKKHAARNGESGRQHRLLLPDSTGDHWVFNTAAYKSYAGLGGGPVVFFCLQPGCRLWSTIRPTDFAADEEISRLIPSLKIMRQEFSRGPTLGEISRTVHLSPFHFHRRFTELIGLTPKHFMLDCQVCECKSQLLSGKKSLAKIAKDCGFAHQSHFTSRFKQATGMTPTRWRRMARERFAESATN
jgi:AraC-like DNA-binding protein